MKIYEIDTQYFDAPIKKGKTIIKVVTLQDHQKELEEQAKQLFKDIELKMREKMNIILRYDEVQKLKKKWLKEENKNV